ncbi:PilZ domain-containing protein [Bdellovibrio bacteriovorus]|jgi:c-di-GMP-binding flagellar brake protein YcgR|uniref:PilZ domain-containing protein n=1 Tax=Bdellovibrio bacteriovorus TaxID=959 RepID=UPI0035A69AF7
MSEALVIFKAIHDEAKKHELLQQLLNSQELISLRDKYDRTIVLKPMGTNDKLQIKCHPPETTAMNTQDSATFTAHFSLKGEKYLFETHPVVNEHNITLTVLNLFHLQRRKNYRYVIPADYSAEFVVTYLNQVVCSHTCRLLDLSTEGCAVEIAQTAASLHLEDMVQAEIFLGDREPILVQGLIKNIRIKDDDFLTLGVEFNHLANASEDRIVSSLTDMQRELYLRKAG